MAWEQLPWDKRLLALIELSKGERGELLALIDNLPSESAKERAVPTDKDVAVPSLKFRLEEAKAGTCWVAVTCIT